MPAHGPFCYPTSRFHVAWGFSPQTPGRGLLHGSPLHSRVQGLRPLTPEPPQTSRERRYLPLSLCFFRRAHGVCRLPNTPPPACLPGRELTVVAAPLRLDLPPLDSKADDAGVEVIQKTDSIVPYAQVMAASRCKVVGAERIVLPQFSCMLPWGCSAPC